MAMDEIYEILEELRPEFDFRKSENFVEDGRSEEHTSELQTRRSIS